MRAFAANGLAICLEQAGRMRNVLAADFWKAPSDMDALGYCRGVVVEFERITLRISGTVEEHDIYVPDTAGEPLDGMIFGWAIDCFKTASLSSV